MTSVNRSSLHEDGHLRVIRGAGLVVDDVGFADGLLGPEGLGVPFRRHGGVAGELTLLG